MSNIRNVFEHVVRKQQKQILLDINCLTRGLFLCFQLTGGDNRQPGAVLCLSQAFPPRAHPGVPPSACGSSSGSLTAAHSISCSQIQSPRPCCSCLPSSCHRSWAGTGHSPPPAARRTECRQSPCRSRPGAIPDTGKTPGEKPVG